jgi:two-component system, response regulator, stage 0 sporulation protein F
VSHAPTILVIDDGSGLQSLLCQILLDAGYSVRALPTREATLRILPDCRQAIVLMEWKAEGITAERFIDAVRRLGGETEIVVMSAQDRAMQAAEACAVKYILRKPFQVEQLLTVVDACVCRRLVQAS